MRANSRIVTALACLVVGVVGAVGAQGGPLASGQLLIQGNRLTIFANELTTDADQTINVGEQARVRTCFGGPSVPCGSVQPGDPRIAGLIVQGELSGPELPRPLALETVPGGAFLLPGFQQEGDYRLENIRLVARDTGQVLGSAEPSVAVLHVRRIVLASATVRALSLEELRARGIVLTEKNFQAFNFAVGFALQDEIVEIEFPVVYSGSGVLNPIVKPKVVLDGLPPDVIDVVARWKPPRIVPFRLEKGPEEDLLERDIEGREELVFPLFGAIVIPGTVTFLNQFFEAQLIVANGADPGSDVTLANLHGALRLPNGNVLRLAETDPPVAPGQEVPVVKPGGGRSLRPGEQGMAAWTIEGLRPGTHSVQMDITGDLVRPGRDPFPVLSRAQAAVEVVDARFNLTFSHPNVVSEGEEYTLFVTVSNMSQATQNLITVEIRDEHITGAHKADPNDDFRRTIETLEPGQSSTLEYELVSDLNGKVVATTFQADSTVALGIIRLRTGVGELGIPLSPATLIMPRFTEYLRKPYVATDELVKSHVRVLKLGYSLAVAPSGQIPPGVPRVVGTDVERRAVDLAEAGQRIYLQEQMLESLEVLALDWLGNRHHLKGMDELRRRTDKGLRAASQLAAQIRLEQADRGLDALELFDHFGETVSYARPWLAATLIPGGPEEVLQLEVRRMTEDGPGVLAHYSDDEAAAQRTLPYGELYAFSRSAGGGQRVPFALIGHVLPEEVFEVVVSNPTSQAASARLVLMVPDGETGDYRRVDFATLTVPASSSVAVDAGAGVADVSSGGFRLRDLATGSPAPGAAVQSAVPLPPFRVIGARQDFRIAEEGPDAFGNWIRPNRYGSGLSYLFNRPPDKEAAENPDNWALRSTFDGLDAVDKPASDEAVKTGEAAFRQENSERVVNVRFSGSIAPLIRADASGPLVLHEQQLDTLGIVDERGNALDPDVPTPVVETVPLHVGGLVDGFVKHGTGNPAPGTKVELIRPRYVETLLGTKVLLDLAATTTTDENGHFFFEFIENPAFWDHQIGGTFTLRATVPAGQDPELEPPQIQEVTSVIRRQNRMAHVNVQLLGRGTITGRLVYLDTQQAVPEGRVTAASTLFNEVKTVDAAADGTFRIPSLPVGPITLTGRDKDNRRVYATVGINQPGDTVDVHLEIQRQSVPQGMGNVTGRVLRRRNDVIEPAEGARVACYSNGHIIGTRETAEDGGFAFADVPEGRVSLQAADFRISRTPTFTDLILADGQTVEVELVLPESSARTVVGKVLFDDPVTRTLVPVQGSVAFIAGPGNYAYTDENGDYRIEGVPVQGVSDRQYSVTVIDNNLHIEESVALPPILDTAPDLITAPTVVLSGVWKGGVDGVVLDPLGRPVAGAELVLFPYAESSTRGDGSFSFDDIPVGDYEVVAHIGDGLTPGRVGFIGDSKARIIYAGHRPFVTIRMVGSGVVNVKTRTATSIGILTPIYYRPTYYSETQKDIIIRGSFFETSTNEVGDKQLVLPVGGFDLTAFNPFHGIREIHGKIEYPGQVVNLDILFEDAGIVKGQVVDVDGLTPVPDVEVTLFTKTLKPQKQFSDAQGHFQFELVPKGGVAVTAAGLVGTVERVGRTVSNVALGGQVVELTVQMKNQGSVRGQVKESFNGELRSLPFAQYYVTENSYPFRRLPPEELTYFTADAEGRFQVSHIFAGRVNVVARDPHQVTRTGSAFTEITADWQVAVVPDIVMKVSIGTLQVTVRDPQTGGPVADAQVRLSNGEVNSSDSTGGSLFEALPLGTYSVYCFNAATGQSGRLNGIQLSSPGQRVGVTVFLDQRGEVLGTLFDDAALTTPIPGGTVQLSGSTAGGRLSALATTSGQANQLGRFAFLGIPEGTFTLTAAVNNSPRRTSTQVSLTETSPVADVNLVLEPVGDVHVRLYEKLTAGTTAIDLASGIFSVRLTQPASRPFALSYDFTQLTPLPASDVFFFPDVLLFRNLTVSGQELSGEQRSASAGLSDLVGNVNNSIPGTGSFADPYRLTLRPKGTVVVHVQKDDFTRVGGVNVTISGVGGSVTGADGSVTFYSVRAGGVGAAAFDPLTKTGGFAGGTLTYDDEVLELTITLAPAVSAHGIVYQPVPDDRLFDASQLVPMEGAIVELRDGKGITQVTLTAADGTYRFTGLATGGFLLRAQNSNGDQLRSATGTLFGPDGNDNELPSLVLDAGPPRILSIVPPPGIEQVSRLAPVEIIFSEPLDPAVVPHNAATSSKFDLRSAGGVRATGVWDSFLDPMGQQVVRFEPSQPYDNLTVYSLTIDGGPNGVRDLSGRLMTASGDVGSNFKTSDSIGPKVIGTVPSLDIPVNPEASIRVDFNEAVVATTEQLDGDGIGDAAELYGERLDDTGASVWIPLPVVLFVTRNGYSLQVEPIQGIAIEGDTLRRRLVISGLLDVFGNLMPVYEKVYRIYDTNSPVLADLPLPANAPDGNLIQGVSYVITPVIDNIDDVTAENPGGDVDRVEYFFLDPADPVNPQTPSYSAVDYPFSYSFIGAYSGNGVDPRPFPVWARVVDTSTNESEILMLDMQVLPNAPPMIGAVIAEALSPVAGIFYAGSQIRAVVTGLDDFDGTRLTLSVELRKDGEAFPIAAPPGRQVNRPSTGWQDLAPQTFSFTLPIDEPEGAPLYFLARVIDTQGARAEVESERFPVADDDTAPRLDSLQAKEPGGFGRFAFFIGDQVQIEFRARDVETAVQSVEVTFDRDDIFPSPVAATLVAGTTDRYRTAPLTVPADVFFETTPVEVTATAVDFGGNTGSQTLAFDVAPEPDPNAPEVEWRAPWPGAEWPASYTSVFTPLQGTPLLLRAIVTDTNVDELGNLVPGQIVSVRFRGPVINESGGVELDSQWTDGELVAGSAAPGRGEYQLLWFMPNQLPPGAELPFAARAVDTGGSATVGTVTMTAVVPRRVYEGVQTAVAPEDPMLQVAVPEENIVAGDPDGPVFVVDGSLLSIRPQPDGSARRLPAVYVYAGGEISLAGDLVVEPTVLTAPEITSFNSAVLFNPLFLEIDRLFAVGPLARVDLAGKGLLGNTGTQTVALPGETVSQTFAGGSHGGPGWFGSPSGGWNRTDLKEPGSTYDSLRDPALPGSGGRGSSTSAGGKGGGVIRILAPAGTVLLHGDLTADGLAGAAGGGGAGGAIRLVAGRLEGRGRLSAEGGAGVNFNTTGGGGGGRISVSYGELAPEVDLDAQAGVRGGHNHASDPSRAVRFGGAGTVFIEEIDTASGQATGPGRLLMANRSGQQAAVTHLPALGDGLLFAVDAAAATVTLDVPRVTGNLVGDRLVLEDGAGALLGLFPITAQAAVAGRVALTVEATEAELAPVAALVGGGSPVAFHGRTRLAGVELRGAVNLLADDDVEIGPADDPAPALNDSAAIVIDGEAAVLLRGEGPRVAFTATPAAGSGVRVGSSISFTWTASDPFGLAETSERSSLDPDPLTRTFTTAPRVVTNGAEPIVIDVPADAPPGEVSYTVDATDVIGRSSSSSVAWTILANAAPTGSVAMADGAPAQVKAGYTAAVVAHAQDLEGLLSLELTVSGPVAEPPAPVALSGLSQDVAFELGVPVAADGSVPLEVRAVITDISGAVTTTDALVVTVLPNELPTGTVALAAGSTSTLQPGESATLAVHAEDPDGLVTIELLAVGEVSPAAQSLAVTETAEDVTFTVTALDDSVPGTAFVSAVLTDAFGQVFETAPFELTLIADVTLPAVELTATPEGPYTSGDVVELAASATDNVSIAQLDLLVDGQVVKSVVADTLAFTWTVPPVEAPTAIELRAEAMDPAGNVGTATLTADVEPLVNDVEPTVSFDCPTSGAYLPSLYDLTLSLSSADDVGIDRVELFRDAETEPFETFRPESGTALSLPVTTTVTLPEALGGEVAVSFRAVAYDSSTNTASDEITIRVVDTVDLDASEAANDWPALESSFAVLRGGTLTLTAPRALGGLILLPGASITHPASAPGSESSVDLAVGGPVYVACGASITGTGRGYASNTTYPGATLPGSESGGSHIGYGGRMNSGRALASTFGSVYRPRENGGGGEHSSAGGRGGGVVRLSAETRLVVDGTLAANGVNGSGSFRRGGGGGSVWVTVAGEVAGGGTIEVRGGNGTDGRSGGGGGAIAVEYQTAAGELLANASSLGGLGGPIGGAGSIYLRPSGALYGDLVLGGAAAGEATRLPALGSGVAQAGSGGAFLVTDLATAIPPYFVGHWVEIFDGVTGAFESAGQITAIDAATLTLTARDGEVVAVDPGDLWQGAYLFDNLELRGSLPLESDDPLRIFGTVEIAGDVQLRELTAVDLVVKSGGRLRHPATPSSASPESLLLDLTGDLVVEPGGSIDASGRGYAANVTYPGEVPPGFESAGSHLGYGGRMDGGRGLASTYGSVYRPQENGGGGEHGTAGGRGGGTVRIFAANVTLTDETSTIRANGVTGSGSFRRGGAGGSVWITTGGFFGDGVVEVRGGEGSDGRPSGGGGAIAVEYTSTSGTVLDHLRAWSGLSGPKGGAGTAYLFGPASTYGDLIIDNGPVSGGTTALPSMGGGIAQAGSGGALLVTGLASVQPYFAGHWVEVRDASGTLKGEFRVAAVSGGTVTLEPDGAAPDVEVGDRWQGIYRFDNYSIRGNFPVLSPDPVRVAGTQEIVGSVEVREIVADTLVLRSGAVLTHPATAGAAAPESLRIELTGDLVIEPGAAIDVSGRGYPANVTYPGATPPGFESAGSHLGHGGRMEGSRTLGSTFGSVYRPQENGGGGEHGAAGGRGGGTVRIIAANVTLTDSTSFIRADGVNGSGSFRRGGGGGSVWIETGGFFGDGVIEVRGGVGTDGRPGGGGGAIAVEYTTTLGSVIENLRSWGGASAPRGGAGTVYLRGPASTFGDLLVDNSTVVGESTLLPALGAGEAQAGSGGAVLVTDRGAPIPPYFVHHWVEIYDGASGELRGTWRIAEVADLTVTLAPDGGEEISILPGDLWQGVYRFDNFAIRGTLAFLSDDPVLVSSTQTLDGDVTLRRVLAGNLTLSAGAVLRQFSTPGATSPESLRIELTDDLLLESGASIDVSGRGFAANVTYPGASPPGFESAGSHMGYGGRLSGTLASTYGSLYRPQENGGGGEHSTAGGRGGGTVRIVAANVTLSDATTAIRANGVTGGGSFRRGGAGGSVWITTDGFSGDGVIEARGGLGSDGRPGGGGGAIAVEYTSTSGTALLNLRSWGGASSPPGGAGTVYLFGPAATYGDLVVDNSTVVGQGTSLPALGGGTAQIGSAGALLVTDLAADIPRYFVGHWVELTAADGTVKGLGRIASLNGREAVLAPAAGETLSVEPGDSFQGLYLFDNFSVRGALAFDSPDPIRVAGTQEIQGTVEAREITGHDLVVRSGSILRHPVTGGATAWESLRIALTGDLVIEPGASIDVSGRGFAANVTYPGATLPGFESAGSHMGYGGRLNTDRALGSTFGSLYRPQEPGGGGEHGTAGGRGGGVVRITAANVTLTDATSVIRVNGVNGSGSFRRGGAGGSVWIETGGFFGDGFIQALGGNGTDGRPSGGGGAIAVEYTSTSGTVLQNLQAWSGSSGPKGGAGTVYLKNGLSTFGTLTVDNNLFAGEATDLPALGAGVAQAGSVGPLLVTDRVVELPAYLVGHWVRVTAPDSTVKGTYRVLAVEGLAMTLYDPLGDPVDLAEGDLFEGLYLFDSITVINNANLISADPIFQGGSLALDGSAPLERVLVPERLPDLDRAPPSDPEKP